MSKKTYQVRVMRPVLVRAVFEVTANSEEEAKKIAVELGDQLPLPAWDDDPGLAIKAHPSVAERVVDAAEEGEGNADPVDLLDRPDCDYVLLQADHEVGEGRLIAPSWLSDYPAVAFADYAHDWSRVTEELYVDGVEAFKDWLRAAHGASNVIDFELARLVRSGRALPPRDE